MSDTRRDLLRTAGIGPGAIALAGCTGRFTGETDEEALDNPEFIDDRPEPDGLLLDEPLSNLEAGLRVEMREAVRRVLDEVDVTAVWVAHDQEEALSIGDRVAVMQAGRLRQFGPPHEVFMQPVSRTVADSLGEASYIPGRRRDGTVETPVWAIDADQLVGYGGPRPDVLVRPDDLALERARSGGADGPVGYRRFNGPMVSYRVTLEDGSVVGCTASNDDLLDRGTPVDVEVVASHRSERSRRPRTVVDPGNGRHAS